MNLNKLKGAVYKRGLTLNDLCERAGLQRVTIWRNFKADDMSIIRVKKIKDALGLTRDELIEIFFER